MVNVGEEACLAGVRAFQAIDKDNSGQLDQDEMKQEVKSLQDLVPDLDFTDEDVISTFDKLDTEKEGLITYS